MDALSAQHRQVKQLRSWLRDRDARAVDQVVVAEGPRVLASLLDHGKVPRAVFVDAAAEHRARRAPIHVAGATIVPTVVQAGALERVGATRTSQGIVAVFDRQPLESARDAVRAAVRVVVLARVNDPGNLGTIARSASAAGFDAMVVGPASVDPYNPKAVRAGAGAVGSLPIWVADGEDDVHEVLAEVAARGGVRLGAGADGAVALDAAPLTAAPLALVLGHETAGLATNLAGDLDQVVAIPMAAGTESLNVAMAATVLCFETARRVRNESS